VEVLLLRVDPCDRSSHRDPVVVSCGTDTSSFAMTMLDITSNSEGKNDGQTMNLRYPLDK
jgi:hypothetical protein